MDIIKVQRQHWKLQNSTKSIPHVRKNELDKRTWLSLMCRWLYLNHRPDMLVFHDREKQTLMYSPAQQTPLTATKTGNKSAAVEIWRSTSRRRIRRRSRNFAEVDRDKSTTTTLEVACNVLVETTMTILRMAYVVVEAFAKKLRVTTRWLLLWRRKETEPIPEKVLIPLSLSPLRHTHKPRHPL